MKTILDIPITPYAQDETITIPVFLDIASESINGIEGTIMYQTEMLDFKEIQDGDSQINFWVEKPHVTNPGTVSFSGITPGGLSGGRKSLFNIVFQTKNTHGIGTVKMTTTVFKSDGMGTPMVLPITQQSFTISTSSVGSVQKNIPKDNDDPEPFVPLIGKDENLFNGKSFIVFSTQDKGSGIDHYEIKEGILGTYTIAESPYLLQYQSLDKIIYIKAVDRSGNKEIITIRGANMYNGYLFLIIAGILIIGIVGVILYKKLWQKKFYSS